MTTHHFKVTAPRTRKRLKKIAQVFCRMLALSVSLSAAPLVIWLSPVVAADSGAPSAVLVGTVPPDSTTNAPPQGPAMPPGAPLPALFSGVCR